MGWSGSSLDETRLFTLRVLIMIMYQSRDSVVKLLISFHPSTANCYSPRGRPADQREAVLRTVHVRSDPRTHPRLPGRRHLARSVTHQRCDARGRVRGVSQTVERHAIRVLHPCGSPRVHCGVSDRQNQSSIYLSLSLALPVLLMHSLSPVRQEVAAHYRLLYFLFYYIFIYWLYIYIKSYLG